MLNKFAYISFKGIGRGESCFEFFGRLFLDCFRLGFLAGW